ncbi:MAG: hypothetical protein MRJ92_12815 [Nitrospira sp.]|nr:hypothetical protein [Nitrospira sp.]
MGRDLCDAVGLSARYGTVSRFRWFLAIGYLAPVAWVYFLGEAPALGGLVTVLVIAALAGFLTLSCLYLVTQIASTLAVSDEAGAGFREVLWQSRWLGLNQLAIVVDVRAPLIILRLMLGETAVGLYGLVQRTTAVVEIGLGLDLQVLMRLFGTRCEQSSRGGGLQVWRAARLTGLMTATLAAGLWFGIVVIPATTRLSRTTQPWPCRC